MRKIFLFDDFQDPKLFWSYVRSKLKTKTSLSQLKLPCGTLTNDNNQKAGLLNVFFASVFETEGEEPIPDFPDRDFNEAITTVDISENVILKAISKLKPSKSQEPDNLHPKLIKECSHQLLTPLKEIFSKSLAESKIPDIWKSQCHGNTQKWRQDQSGKLPTNKSNLSSMQTNEKTDT